MHTQAQATAFEHAFYHTLDVLAAKYADCQSGQPSTGKVEEDLNCIVLCRIRCDMLAKLTVPSHFNLSHLMPVI
jgi:hypothetical protein